MTTMQILNALPNPFLAVHVPARKSGRKTTVRKPKGK